MVQAGCKLTPTRRALLAEGLCSNPRNALGPRRLRPTGCAGVGQPGSRGWFINGWVWNGLRQPVLWMTAGIVDDRAFLSFGEVVVLYKGIFFQCSVFLICPPLSTLFLFTEFVYGIHLIFFQSSRVESLSLRCFLPSRPWERPHARVSARVVHAKPSERAASFRAHTGRNVWLWLKVEKLFGVSFFNFHSRAV